MSENVVEIRPKTSWDLILPFLRPIESLILDQSISEICVNGDGSIYVERSGLLESVQGIVFNQQTLLAGVKAIARRLGDDISESQPILDSRLEDGSRVAAVIPPCSLYGITLTIRKFVANRFTIDDLIERDSITKDLACLLSRSVAERRNILISGGTGTGKTTILNILSAFIPDDDRIVIIEDTAEIQIDKPNLVRFEARRERPGAPAVTIRQLLKSTLRHRPDRIVVGEIRDGAAYDLLQALNTGHSGSMSTVHADSAKGALQRFSSLVLESGVQIPFKAIKSNIGDALHLLLQIERREGKRYVSQLLALDGYVPDTDDFSVRPIFQRNGPRDEGRLLGSL